MCPVQGRIGAVSLTVKARPGYGKQSKNKPATDRCRFAGSICEAAGSVAGAFSARGNG